MWSLLHLISDHHDHNDHQDHQGRDDHQDGPWESNLAFATRSFAPSFPRQWSEAVVPCHGDDGVDEDFNGDDDYIDDDNNDDDS